MSKRKPQRRSAWLIQRSVKSPVCLGLSLASDNTTALVNSPVSPNVFYTADTLLGSLGSRVRSQNDNTVVVLHHAGGSAPISYGTATMLLLETAAGVALVVAAAVTLSST